MIWKIFGILSIFGAYAWFVGSNNNASFYQTSACMYKYICDFAEEHELRLHIHTPECFLHEEH